MKKLFTIACTLVIGGVLAFAQAGGSTGQTPASGDQTQAPAHKSAKKSTKTKKSHHKGGKKSKKGAGTESTTPPPK